jgi:Flp pilus assembly protein TadD
MPSAHPSNPSHRGPLLAVACLIAAGLLAWSNSFSGPFVFDDRPAILANPTLHHLSDALSPPRDGGTTSGRPLVNVSLALNFALSGTSVGSYHALNLAIHLLAGLTLFGLIRRTLLLSGGPPAGTSIAFSAALLWLLHPLQTAAVTYVVQRAESLMALFFLLTLYAFVRAVAAETDPVGNARRNRWLALSVTCCLAGMACKEVMAVAPLVVWLYDRTFVAGGFLGALRRKVGYYLALASTWGLLAGLVVSNHSRSGTAGFGGAVAPLEYAFTQCAAIVRYLMLAVWPRNLVFDYGTSLIGSFTEIWPQALLLLVLIVGIAWALRRVPVLGFLGMGFFLVLAPSSSVVPIATQTIAEHRMYLPLAALATAVVLGLQRFTARWTLPIAVVLGIALGAATFQRNRDYRDPVTLWADTVAKRPENARARNHLGIALAQSGKSVEAIPHYEAALRISPQDAETHHNLANAFKETSRSVEALAHYERAVQLKPDLLAARLALANALVQAGRTSEALAHYAAAEKLGALDAQALGAYGATLASMGNVGEAIPRYERALQLAPKDAQLHYNLGLAFARTGRFPEAIEHFRTATQLEPSNLPARVNLANALLVAGRPSEAIAEYESALRLRPNDPQIRANLARARTQVR